MRLSREKCSERKTPRLTVQYAFRQGVTVVTLLDATIVGRDNGGELASAVCNRLAHDSPVVLDASRIEFFDPEGVDVLLSIDGCATQRKASFSLCGLNGSVAQVFRISGLDCLFRIFPDVDAAVDAAAAQDATPERWH